MSKFLNLILVISALSTLFANDLEQMFQRDSIFDLENDSIDYFEDQNGMWSLKSNWSHLSQNEDPSPSEFTLLNPYSISYKNQYYHQRLYIKNSGSKYFSFEGDSNGLELHLGRQKMIESPYSKSSNQALSLNFEDSHFSTYQSIFLTSGSAKDSLFLKDSIPNFKWGLAFNKALIKNDHYFFLNANQIHYLNHFYLGGLQLSFYGPDSPYYLLEVESPQGGLFQTKYQMIWYPKGINSDFLIKYPLWQTKAFSENSTLFFDIENHLVFKNFDLSLNSKLWQNHSNYFYSFSFVSKIIKEHYFYYKNDIKSKQHFKYKFKNQWIELSHNSTFNKNQAIKESRQSFTAKLTPLNSFNLAYKINYQPQIEQFFFFKLSENPETSHWQIKGRLDLKHSTKASKDLRFLLQVSYTFQSIE